MNKKTILVTGIGGDVGQDVIRCLKDSGYGDSIIGCDIERYVPGRQNVNKFFNAPRASDRRAYLKFLTGIVKKESVAYIFPMPEIEIGILSEERNIFKGNPKVMINDPMIIRTFSDKFETAAFLKKSGFPHPRTFLPEELRGELVYPFLLKQRRWGGAKDVVIVHDDEEFAFYIKKGKDRVAQEIIGSADEEYTVGVFSDGRKIYSIAFRRSLGYGSLSKSVELMSDEVLDGVAADIARAVSLKGSINIQLRKKGKVYIPFEINPRFSSTVHVRHCFGFQDVKWWLDMEEGRPISYAPQYKEGVAVRTLGEAFFNMVRV